MAIVDGSFGSLYFSDAPDGEWKHLGEVISVTLTPKQTKELFLTALFYAFMYRN